MLGMFLTCFVTLKCGEDFDFLLAVHARSGDHLPLLPVKRDSTLFLCCRHLAEGV